MIKVVAKNEIGEVSKTVEIIATKVLVESITLNKTKTTVMIGKTLTLTATVKPEDATNKTIKWTSSNEDAATVSDEGVITGKTEGTATITAVATDGSEVKATCNITVMDENTATWEEINKMAEEIANDDSITNDSSQATVIIDGETKTISVGGIYTVKYNGVARRVRVLGFKHDDLVDSTVYGGTHEKASISFEFLDFMTGNTYMRMNSSNTNSGGWGNTEMRKNLNGYTTNEAIQSGTIGGLGANLSNKAYVKQVKKQYISQYNNAGSVKVCNDYLWLLGCSEIVNSGYKGGYSYAITSEGSQYKYYQGVTAAWNSNSTGRIKYNGSNTASYWALRSPSNSQSECFEQVGPGGAPNRNGRAIDTQGVALGFCI